MSGKRLFALTLVFVLLFTLTAGVAGANPKNAKKVVPTGDPEPYSPYTAGGQILYAGQNNPVGKIVVTNDATNIYVNFVLDPDKIAEGWTITETHVHAGATLGLFPLNNGGNPQVGLFEFSGTGTSYTIPYTGLAGDKMLIAAHAVITKTNTHPGDILTVDFESVVGMDVYGPIYEAPNAGTNWGSPVLAVEAENNIAGASWVWGKGNAYNPTYDPDIDGVIWISTAADTENWLVDSWRKVVLDFEVEGTLLSNFITINSDNEYWAYLNGTQVGTGGIWVDPQTHQIGPVQGDNTLEIVWLNLGQSDDQVNNPNGVTFKGEVSYQLPDWYSYDNESAWAFGTPFVSQGNWATFFEYTIAAVGPQYTLLEEVLVPSTDATGVTTSNTLAAGQTYRLVASGTYTYNNQYDWADAEWYLKAGVIVKGDTEGSVPHVLDVSLDGYGSNIYWGAYNADHIYEYEIVGNGSTLRLFIHDSNYTDNRGGITVRIYTKNY